MRRPPFSPPAPFLSALLAACGAVFVFGVVSLVRELSSPFSPPRIPAAKTAPAAPVVFLKAWCYECHGDGAAKGGFDLEKPLTSADWRKMERHVLLHTMPPPAADSPNSAERDRFSDDLSRWLATLPETERPAPLRRLNRAEYNRSVHALLGTEARPADDFPDDETAHGFDNNGDMQPLPPTLMERYVKAAEDTARAALVVPAPPPRVMTRTADQMSGGVPPLDESPGWRWLVDADRPVTFAFETAAAGEYRYTITARAHQAGGENARLLLTPGEEREIASVSARAPDRLTGTVQLPAGNTTFTLRLANPFSDPGAADPHRRERHALVSKIELEGPMRAASLPGPAFASLFPHPPSSLDLARAAAEFAARAWRRPLTAEETARFQNVTGRATAQAGLPAHEVMALAVSAALASPHFLFLTDPAEVTGEARSHAFAARLSYFLTGAPPDSRLTAAAARGWSADTLRTEALRLLASPDAVSLADDFAGQWLRLRNMTPARPDKVLFPEADAALLTDMAEESRLFFLDLVRENAPVLRLADADWTFVNPRLARHYHLPEPAGDGFTKTPLTGTARRGILTQGGVLTLTSYPNRTSPVLRGKWILEALLGLEPPPPPPNVPTLEVTPAAAAARGPESVRAALERHRADKSCAACHAAIDPPGFALEGFDAIGRERPTAPGETSAPVFTGETIDGPAALSRWLAGPMGARIVRHTAERLLTFALGRGLTAAESLHASALADACGGRGARFRDLILAVVASPVFRGEPPPAP